MDIVFPSIRLPLPIVPCLCPSVHVCIPLRPPRLSSLRAFLRLVPPSHFTVYRGTAAISSSLLSCPLLSVSTSEPSSSYFLFPLRFGLAHIASFTRDSASRIKPPPLTDGFYHSNTTTTKEPLHPHPHTTGGTILHYCTIFHRCLLFRLSSTAPSVTGPARNPGGSSRLLLRTLKLVRLLLGSRRTKLSKRKPRGSQIHLEASGRRLVHYLVKDYSAGSRLSVAQQPSSPQQRHHRDSGCCWLSFASHHQPSKRQSHHSLGRTHFVVVVIRGSTIARADDNFHKLLLVCVQPTLRILLPITVSPSATYLIFTFASHWSRPVHHHRSPPPTAQPSPPQPPPPPPPSPSSSGATSTTSLPKPVHPPPPSSAPNHDLPGPRYRPKCSTAGYQSSKKENTPACAFHGGAAISFLPRPSCSHGLTHGLTRTVVSRCLMSDCPPRLSPITIGLNRDSE